MPVASTAACGRRVTVTWNSRCRERADPRRRQPRARGQDLVAFAHVAGARPYVRGLRRRARRPARCAPRPPRSERPRPRPPARRRPSRSPSPHPLRAVARQVAPQRCDRRRGATPACPRCGRRTRPSPSWNGGRSVRACAASASTRPAAWSSGTRSSSSGRRAPARARSRPPARSGRPRHGYANRVISVVVPVYDEERSVELLFDEIRAALEPLGRVGSRVRRRRLHRRVVRR